MTNLTTEKLYMFITCCCIAGFVFGVFVAYMIDKNKW